jgi:two-component system alkaline phosphatase synthesis response regulator PhoP
MNPSNAEKSILLIDDEKDILDILSYSLKKEGYKVFTANNGLEGTKFAKDLNPDLIVLDVMMPQMDGIEACQIIRNELQLKKPIIAFLTSRSEDYSQIAGLEAGADDYITKPIRPRLFLSKVESLLRRADNASAEAASTKEIKIDREKFLVTIKGKEMILPKKEFELLELLASRPGRVFHRNQIMNIVWGDGAIVGERTIDVHIRKLREKLGNNYIRTIKGVGYTFSEV